jgi:trehalose utilization protein
MHNVIAAALSEDAGIAVEAATLQEPEHGLPEDRLATTDVLLWWGHKAHGRVDAAVVERVLQRVWDRIGRIVLHSGHYSKIFKRLIGMLCNLGRAASGKLSGSAGRGSASAGRQALCPVACLRAQGAHRRCMSPQDGGSF